MLTNIDGLLSLPAIRSNDLELIQRDGLWPGNDYLGARTVNITLRVQGRDIEEFSKAINDIQSAFTIGVEGESKLEFRIPGIAFGRSAYLMARTRRRSAPLDMSFPRLHCRFEIELLATDPVIYASDETTCTLRNGKPVGPNTRVTVYGSRPARPVITYTNCAYPEITNLATGDITTFFREGSFVVDTAKQDASLGIGAVWPAWGAGEHFLNLTNLDSAPASATAVLKWRDSWV
ncbi:phage tail family protein [Streptomyces katsurahamanus]|uniref:Phage tail family protein n=1 Tax=Streptomyces katsurahamanus TaxID=2577098 RepID=A0ABW9P383_9ACTN|nr:hypothetical protein [Streptomyces katsurahamanus]MQS39928.1 hypothetical protein [Streptomyces katsurahamanus]